MKVYIDKPKSQWSELTVRPTMDESQLEAIIQEVFDTVSGGGDEALIRYTQKFDNVSLETVTVSREYMRSQAKLVEDSLQQAIDQAYENIYAFHKQQELAVESIETSPGVTCWRESRAIESVGLYVPGGSAPLISTVLMLGVPAQIAGCSQITLATPPAQDDSIDPAICYAALKIGLESIVSVGGSQAIAAMALGTESVPKVDKIFGPGNQYVTAAKMWAQRLGTAIDMPAGPSEVLVVADESANPAFVAADLLSQAEHGPDSQVVFVSTSEQMITSTSEQIEAQLLKLPRADIARSALENSFALLVSDASEALSFSNMYAPEHLILNVDQAESLVPSVQTAGSVFIGAYTPESAGDYASGTNHSLPTNGYASSYSGVSLDSFVKKITFQKITKQGLQTLGPAITSIARAEGLDAHANAVTVRTTDS